jgi:uncharacterized protein (DUF2267 family)
VAATLTLLKGGWRMGFRELIVKVQKYSGFSDAESKDALECMVENLAVRLDEHDRKDFANQLPEELQDIALTVIPTPENTKQEDIVARFMELQGVDEPHAKLQITSAWNALKETIAPSELDDIRSHLPRAMVSFLY